MQYFTLALLLLVLVASVACFSSDRVNNEASELSYDDQLSSDGEPLVRPKRGLLLLKKKLLLAKALGIKAKLGAVGAVGALALKSKSHGRPSSGHHSAGYSSHIHTPSYNVDVQSWH